MLPSISGKPGGDMLSTHHRSTPGLPAAGSAAHNCALHHDGVVFNQASNFIHDITIFFVTTLRRVCESVHPRPLSVAQKARTPAALAGTI
jgi:hypothetical protein